MSLNIKELYDNNEIIPYKNKVMNVLTSSEMLYELVTNQPCEDIELSEELIWKNYIPQLFVDGTITDTEAYIMYDIEVRKQRVNTYNTYNIYFQIVCHKKITKVNGVGTRCDCIVSELCRLFKDKILYADNGFGIGKNEKNYDKVLVSPNDNFVSRELSFTVVDFDERVKQKYGG